MFAVNDKVTYQLNKTTRGNAVVVRISSTKKRHVYIATETQGTILVNLNELEAAH